MQARFWSLSEKNIFQKKFSSPSGCSTEVGKVTGEMITYILHIIEIVMSRIHPQNRFQLGYAKQEEFPFVHGKSTSF